MLPRSHQSNLSTIEISVSYQWIHSKNTPMSSQNSKNTGLLLINQKNFQFYTYRVVFAMIYQNISVILNIYLSQFKLKELCWQIFL